MKLSLALLIVMLVQQNVFAGEPYPAVNTKYFDNGALNEKYMGKLIAIEGMIERLEIGPVGRPLLQIALPHPIYKSIWIGSLVKDQSGILEKGNIIRVLGYLKRVESEDTFTVAITSDDFHVLGFCFLNISKMKGVFFSEGIKQCKGWQSGKNAAELM